MYSASWGCNCWVRHSFPKCFWGRFWGNDSSLSCREESTSLRRSYFVFTRRPSPEPRADFWLHSIHLLIQRQNWITNFIWTEAERWRYNSVAPAELGVGCERLWIPSTDGVKGDTVHRWEALSGLADRQQFILGFCSLGSRWTRPCTCPPRSLSLWMRPSWCVFAYYTYFNEK